MCEKGARCWTLRCYQQKYSPIRATLQAVRRSPTFVLVRFYSNENMVKCEHVEMWPSLHKSGAGRYGVTNKNTPPEGGAFSIPCAPQHRAPFQLVYCV
jgi:hypothetical protein